MHSTLPGVAATAIVATARTDENPAQTGSEFFAGVCKTIFGKDAGLALHYATGVPERSCYRYASGERDVPILVFRSLLHSEQGEPFFRALMEGCTAKWWLEFERAQHVGAQVLEITKRS